MPAYGLREKYERLKRGQAVASDGTVYRIPYYAKRNVVLVTQQKVTPELLSLDDSFDMTSTGEQNPTAPDMSSIMAGDTASAANELLNNASNASNAADEIGSTADTTTDRATSSLNIDSPSPILQPNELPTTLNGMSNFFGNKNELLDIEKSKLKSALGSQMGGTLSTLEGAGYSAIGGNTFGAAQAILANADLNSMNVTGGEQAMMNKAVGLGMGGQMPSTSSLASMGISGLGGMGSLGADTSTLASLGMSAAGGGLDIGTASSAASMLGMTGVPNLMSAAGALQGSNPMDMAQLLANKDKCLQLIKSLESLQGMPNALALAFKKLKETVKIQFQKLKASIIAMAESKYMDPLVWTDMAMAFGGSVGECSYELLMAASDADISKAYYESKRRGAIALDLMEEQWEKFWDAADEQQEAAEQALYKLGTLPLAVAKATTSPTKMIQGAKKLCEFSQRLQFITMQMGGLMKSAALDSATALATSAAGACGPAGEKLVSNFKDNFGDASTTLEDMASDAAGEVGEAVQDQLGGTVGEALGGSVGDVNSFDNLNTNDYVGDNIESVTNSQTWESEDQYLTYMNNYYKNSSNELNISPPTSKVSVDPVLFISPEGEQQYINTLENKTFTSNQTNNLPVQIPSVENTSASVAAAIAKPGNEITLGSQMASLENSKNATQQLFVSGVKPGYETPLIGSIKPRAVIIPSVTQNKWQTALRENLKDIFSDVSQLENIQAAQKRISAGR